MSHVQHNMHCRETTHITNLTILMAW